METGFFFGAANSFFIEKLSAITIIINCYCHSCTVESKSLGSWNHNHFTFWSHKLFSKFPFHFMSNFPFIVNLKKPACAFKQVGLIVVFTIIHVFLQEHLLFCIYQDDKHLGANRSTYIRVGKTGSLGPWSRVIHCKCFPHKKCRESLCRKVFPVISM